MHVQGPNADNNPSNIPNDHTSLCWNINNLAISIICMMPIRDGKVRVINGKFRQISGVFFQIIMTRKSMTLIKPLGRCDHTADNWMKPDTYSQSKKNISLLAFCLLKVHVLKSLENKLLLNWKIWLIFQTVYHQRWYKCGFVSRLQTIRENSVYVTSVFVNHNFYNF